MTINKETNRPDANYVKLNISLFLPALLQITGEENFGWGRIDQLFSAEISKRLALAKGQPVTIKATIYDIIVEAKRGDSTAVGLLHFLNHVFEDLAKQLTPMEKQMLRSNIKKLLTTLDWRFYNYVGEIGALNNLMQTKAYRLQRIESPLPNGKTIDFQLHHIQNGNSLLVEIFNIHLDSERVESDPAAIRAFLTHRLTEKILEKKIRLKEDVHFYLVPVLWGPWKDVEVYSNFFKVNKLPLENVLEPIALLTRSDGQGYYHHDFARVSTLLKTEIIQ
jgi:hypothetical protein